MGSVHWNDHELLEHVSNQRDALAVDAAGPCSPAGPACLCQPVCAFRAIRALWPGRTCQPARAGHNSRGRRRAGASLGDGIFGNQAAL